MPELTLDFTDNDLEQQAAIRVKNASRANDILKQGSSSYIAPDFPYDLSPILWRRYHHGDKRFYYRIEEFLNQEGDLETLIHKAIGITTVLSGILPTPEGIKAFWLKHGKDAPKVLSQYADYGTIMHIMIEQWVKGYNPYALIPDELPRNQKVQLKKNMISFIRFCEDYHIKPLACEMMLEWNGIAGTMDFLCWVRIPMKRQVEQQATNEDGSPRYYKKGGTKGGVKYKVGDPYMELVWEHYLSNPMLAIIDFKSALDMDGEGKDSKDHYDSHLYQLLFLRRAVSHNFGVPVEDIRVMNWSPLGWRTEPKYSLTNWEEEGGEPHKYAPDIKMSVWEQELDMFLELALLRGVTDAWPRQQLVFAPLFDEDNNPVPSSQAYRYATIDEIILEKLEPVGADDVEGV